jgi:hypothetical protein
VDFITTKYTCTSVSRRTQNFETGNNIVSPNFVVVVAEVVSLGMGMDMVMEVVVFDSLVSDNIYCFPVSETWSLALRNAHRLRTFENKSKENIFIETERI